MDSSRPVINMLRPVYYHVSPASIDQAAEKLQDAIDATVETNDSIHLRRAYDTIFNALNVFLVRFSKSLKTRVPDSFDSPFSFEYDAQINHLNDVHRDIYLDIREYFIMRSQSYLSHECQKDCFEIMNSLAKGFSYRLFNEQPKIFSLILEHKN